MVLDQPYVRKTMTGTFGEKMNISESLKIAGVGLLARGTLAVAYIARK